MLVDEETKSKHAVYKKKYIEAINATQKFTSKKKIICKCLYYDLYLCIGSENDIRWYELATEYNIGIQNYICICLKWGQDGTVVIFRESEFKRLT